jgi:glycosyltransferase involved in cell wall biosynthesis
VAYIEDLMDEQVRRGHEVAYFFSGRQYPGLRRPRLRRWERGRIAMLEIVNSPLYDHGRQPELEVAEPRIERMLDGVLGELRPDVVHIQEMAGLPSSVLDVVRASGTPQVVTLQDYFPLCSTFKLIDAAGQVCARRAIGADCVATTAADPRRPGLMIEATVLHELKRLPAPGRFEPQLVRVAKRVGAAGAARRPLDRGRNDPAAFQRRRELNVQRLSRADRVIAMSHRVEEIYAQMGVDPSRLCTVHLTLGHIERLTPRSRPEPRTPLTFATLAGFESAPKGGPLLVDALRRLRERAAKGDFRLLVYGHTERRFAEAARQLPGVELRGAYRPNALDTMLDEADVGIVPSVWEEAYGFAGVEFLAKGVPVIGNAIGGIPDYTRDGETGWLNRSMSSAELARIMESLIDDPAQVAKLNAKLVANHDSIVTPIARHADEMDDVYREVIAAQV